MLTTKLFVLSILSSLYMVEFFASREICKVRVWKKDNEKIYEDDRHYDDTQYAEKELSIIQLVK